MKSFLSSTRIYVIMSKLGQTGKITFLGGLSCGESIVKTVRDSKIIPVPEELLRVSSAFKGGIASQGHLCGCVSTSISLLGLKYGRIDKSGDLSVLDEKVSSFIDIFLKKQNSLQCRDITASFRKRDAFNTPERRAFCSEIVAWTLDTLVPFFKK